MVSLNWERLIRFLDEQLEKNKGKKILLTSKYIYLNKVCIGLLKLLLGIKKSRGIYIAIDRPYYYTSRLLTKHGVPQDNLFFLDAVSTISSEKVKKAKNVEMIENPFCSTILPEAKERLEDLSKNGGIDFIFLDNITVMLNYMDEKCVYSFLGQFVILLDGSGKTVTLVIVDKDAHPKAYENAKEKSDVEVEISSELIIG